MLVKVTLERGSVNLIFNNHSGLELCLLCNVLSELMVAWWYHIASMNWIIIQIMACHLFNTNLNQCSIIPQSHPTTGPVRFLSPIRFLARRNFTLVLFSWSHQAIGPVRLDTALYLWFGRMIRRTPRVPVRCPYGHRTDPARESSMFFISYRTRAGPARGP